MPVGRRERNKEEKRERILAAATELFATRGIDEVTTQEIAEAADIGAGTLFLYAKNKGELLLMVQNARYAHALAQGVGHAGEQSDAVEAVMSVLSPIVVCNRAHVDNGRAYLREVAFGDPSEHHHARALEIVADTELELAGIVQRLTQCDEEVAVALARAVSGVLLRNLAGPEEFTGGVEQILLSMRRDLTPLVLALV